MKQRLYEQSFRVGIILVKWEPTKRDSPCVVLLNRERQIRGQVIKSHEYYAVLDSRGATVKKSRKLDDVLSMLTG